MSGIMIGSAVSPSVANKPVGGGVSTLLDFGGIADVDPWVPSADDFTLDNSGGNQCRVLSGVLDCGDALSDEQAVHADSDKLDFASAPDVFAEMIGYVGQVTGAFFEAAVMLSSDYTPGAWETFGGSGGTLNGYRIAFNSDGDITLEKMVTGTATVLFTYTDSPIDGGTVRLRATVEGSNVRLRVYHNGTLVHGFVDTAPSTTAFRTGGFGLVNRQGSAPGPSCTGFNAATITSTPISSQWTDDFNRADAESLGAGWTETVDNWRILSNQAHNDAFELANASANHEITAQSEFEVAFLDWVASSTESLQNRMGASVDGDYENGVSGNGYIVLNNSTTSWSLYRLVGGTLSIIDTNFMVQDPSVAADYRLRFTIGASSVIVETWVDNELRGVFEDTDPARIENLGVTAHLEMASGGFGSSSRDVDGVEIWYETP